MRRREFITLFGGGAVAWPRGAWAQQRAKKIPRIGIIDDGPIWEPFRRAFRDAGYVEGQTIDFEYRRGDGDPRRPLLSQSGHQLDTVCRSISRLYSTDHPSRADMCGVH
jgi:putative ABC transport system substrate-binding protein